jgi:hypothetical protein
MLGRNKSILINERAIFAAVLEQRALVEKARKDTPTARRSREKMNARKAVPQKTTVKQPIVEAQSEQSPRPVEPYKVEVWE